MYIKTSKLKEARVSALTAILYVLMACLFVSSLFPYTGNAPFDIRDMAKKLLFTAFSGGLLVVSSLLCWIKGWYLIDKKKVVLFILLTIVLLCLIVQGLTNRDLLSFVSFSVLIVAFGLCRTHCKDADKYVFACLIGCGAFCICVVLVQFVLKKTIIELYFDSITEWSLPVVVSYVIVVNWLLIEKRNSYRILYICIMFVIVVVLTFVGSRNSLLSISVISIISIKKNCKVVIVIILLAFLMVNTKKEKQESSLGRTDIITTSFSMLCSAKKLLFGRGAYSFENEYMLFQKRYLEKADFASRQRADEIAHPLNEYLYLTVNHGLLFLLALMIIVGAFIRRHSMGIYGKVMIAILMLSHFSYPLAYPWIWGVAAWCFSCEMNVYRNKEGKCLNKVLLTFLMFLGGVLVVNSYELARIYDYWTKSYDKYLIGNKREAIASYALIGKEMDDMPYFIFNYATLLLYSGEGQYALSVMKSCQRCNYETTMLMGDIYENLHDYSQAHKCYDLAYGMCPNRFAPLYKKVLIYKKTCESEQKRQMCKIILSKPIKIKSKSIDEILNCVKQEIKKEK